MRNRFPPILFAATLLVSTLSFTACTKDKKEEPAPTLYVRLGSVDGISRIVDGLVANVGAECSTPTSALKRTHTDLLASTQPGSTDPTRLQRLRNHFIDQVGEASGGPVRYTGMNMVAAHRGMHITEAEYAVWRTQLSESLVTNSVGATEKAEVLAIMDNMKPQFIGI